MKTRKFRHGKTTYTAYCKPVGRGWEVGYICGSKVLFVGNFVHSGEANTWFTKMCGEIVKFSRKYWVTTKSSPTFYQKFILNHLYKTYYLYLDRVFTGHQRTYGSKFHKDERRYMKMKRNWDPKNRTSFRRAV